MTKMDELEPVAGYCPEYLRLREIAKANLGYIVRSEDVERQEDRQWIDETGGCVWWCAECAELSSPNRPCCERSPGRLSAPKGMHERRYRRHGTMSTPQFAGVMYVIGEDPYVDPYVREANGCVHRRNPETGDYEPITDPGILATITAMADEDQQIRAARDAHAKVLANGDALLEVVLRTHMEFTGGRVHRPDVIDGVPFYAVGQNASHEFSIGTKNGKCYRHSYGEAACDDEEGRPVYEGDTSEVASWAGCYLGHC